MINIGDFAGDNKLINISGIDSEILTLEKQ